MGRLVPRSRSLLVSRSCTAVCVLFKVVIATRLDVAIVGKDTDMSLGNKKDTTQAFGGNGSYPDSTQDPGHPLRIFAKRGDILGWYCGTRIDSEISLDLDVLRKLPANFFDANLDLVVIDGKPRLMANSAWHDVLFALGVRHPSLDVFPVLVLPGQELTSINGWPINETTPMDVLKKEVNKVNESDDENDDGALYLKFEAGRDFRGCWTPPDLETQVSQSCTAEALDVAADALSHVHQNRNTDLPVLEGSFSVKKVNREEYLLAKTLMDDVPNELYARVEEQGDSSQSCAITSLTPICVAVVAPRGEYWLVVRALPFENDRNAVEDFADLQGPYTMMRGSEDRRFVNTFGDGLALEGCASVDVQKRLAQDSAFLMRHSILGYSLHVRLLQNHKYCTCGDSKGKWIWPLQMVTPTDSDSKGVAMGITNYVRASPTTHGEAVEYRDLWMLMLSIYFRVPDERLVTPQGAMPFTSKTAVVSPKDVFFLGDDVKAQAAIAWKGGWALQTGKEEKSHRSSILLDYTGPAGKRGFLPMEQVLAKASGKQRESLISKISAGYKLFGRYIEQVQPISKDIRQLKSIDDIKRAATVKYMVEGGARGKILAFEIHGGAVQALVAWEKLEPYRKVFLTNLAQIAKA